jgi:uncharacterized membrane protein YfcA
MTILQACALFLAAILAGALNSVAGGGSFISFPTILLTFPGVPDIPIKANATNTVALWPGSMASVGAYRRELGAQRHVMLPLAVVSLIGGIIGALLLLRTPSATFNQMIPFLLLFATLVFTFNKPITTRLRALRRNQANDPSSAVQPDADRQPGARPNVPAVVVGVVLLLQLATAIYGGFFGGGIGIIMLALLGLLGMDHIHEMNALKTLLAVCVNGVAVVMFALAGTVLWPQAILMVAGAIIGGYGGAHYARQIDPELVRRFVILVGFVMTCYFFFFRR